MYKRLLWAEKPVDLILENWDNAYEHGKRLNAINSHLDSLNIGDGQLMDCFEVAFPNSSICIVLQFCKYLGYARYIGSLESQIKALHRSHLLCIEQIKLHRKDLL